MNKTAGSPDGAADSGKFGAVSEEAREADAAPAGGDEPPEESGEQGGSPESPDDLDAHKNRLLEQAKDQLLRTLAEGENLRRRTEKQVADARQFAVEAFARDLLSVTDNLSRALDASIQGEQGSAGAAAGALRDGVEMTHRELIAVLERHGVTPIAADPGMPFDPNLHQAVNRIPSPQPKGTVAQCLQSGWHLRERVLRAAMVVVSDGSPGSEIDVPPRQPGGSVDIEA